MHTIFVRASVLGKDTAWKSKEDSNLTLCQRGIFAHVLLKVIYKVTEKESQDILWNSVCKPINKFANSL